MELITILNNTVEFRYQLLGRMQSDCEYYLGYGNRNASKLWALDEKKHIKYMKAIWKSFPKEGKPEWLKYGQIIAYEKQMVIEQEKASNWMVGYITTDNILVCSYTGTDLNEAKKKMKEVIRYWERLGVEIKISVDYNRYTIDKQTKAMDNAYIVDNYYKTNGCKDKRNVNCLSHRHYILNDITYIIVDEASYYYRKFIRGVSMQLI